jgi:DNA-binding response OmpR family regulator
VNPLDGKLTVLAVQADEAAHAPVRAALKAIQGSEYEIHWVTTPRAALAALDEHPHDAFLVDRELHDTGHSGLDVARDILAHTPYAPVILLDDAADRETDVAAAEAGVSDYLVHPSPTTLERSLRYSITHQRALKRLAESEERHALALQGANDGDAAQLWI